MVPTCTSPAPTRNSIRKTDAWVIDITLASTSATQWDVVAQQSLHAYVGFDLNGAILEAPLIQPNQSTFASFQGKMEISSNMSETEAKGLAALIGSGPLPVPFSLQSLTHDH